MSKKIEDRYKKLSHREHVLKRKNMYCGSPNTEESEMFVVDNLSDLSDITISKKKVMYNPAFIKLFDEVISNAGDYHIRTKKVKNIKINVDDKSISVENDGGGIPIELHKEENIYVPEMIFGHLLTGENYDDEEQKLGAGQNGLGVKIVNILSDKFIIDTADGKKHYKQTFQKNMSIVKDATIKPLAKKYTKVTYHPDFSQFEGLDSITDDTKSIILKRIIDLAVYLPDVRFTYNGKLLKVKSMKDFMKLHLPEGADLIYEKLDNGWEVGIAKSLSDTFTQVSICSSVSTYRGGTHVNHVSLELSKDLAETITKGNKKINITWADVKNKLFLFLIAKVPNPTFDTQTKEALVNTITKEIHQNATISKNTIKKVMKSDIVQSIMDYIELKKQQELKKLNKSLQKVKVEKLIDAKGKDRQSCILGIYEGDSALSAVRKFRDPNTMGAFPLRGKFLNVSEMNASTVIKNNEVQNLISSLGIRLGEKVNENDLRYGKVYIFTDADSDGDAISALLINFFYKYFPELFDQERIYKVQTPILVAQKKGGKKIEKVYIYTNKEFEEWQTKNDVKQYDIEYKKGLASLTNDEYEIIIQDPKLIKIQPDVHSQENLEIWFGKDSSRRKEKLI